MAKIRLTKNELKRQKETLKRYEQYLPTLLLKKQQLQMEIQKIHQEMENLKKEREYEKAHSYKWVDVFNERVGIERLIKQENVITSIGNIAGVDIPVFEKIIFKEEEYDLLRIPLWVDFGILALKRVMTLNAKMDILRQQDQLIKEELRVTTQRVNLFEKIKIPEAKRNIHKIQIYLGDLQTAAVVTGKIAKEKIVRMQA